MPIRPFAVLVSYAIRSGRIDQAEKLVSEASTQSKPRLELQLGNAMWARYLEMSQAGQATRPTRLRSKAEVAGSEVSSRWLRRFKEGCHRGDLGATTGLYLAQRC